MSKVIEGTYDAKGDIPVWVDIIPAGASDWGEKELITLASNPVTISYSGDANDALSPIKSSSATIRVVNDGVYNPQLIAIEPRSTRVAIYMRGRELVWSGFLTPSCYSQEYNSPLEVLELECQDKISALKLVKFSYVGPALISVQEFFERIGELLEEDYMYIADRRYSETGVLVNQDNFFDEDGEPMNWFDVISEFCRMLSLTLTYTSADMYANSHMIFYSTIAQTSVYSKTFQKVRGVQQKGYVDWSVVGDVELDQHIAISAENIKSSDINISVIGPFNNIEVKSEFYSLGGIEENYADFKVTSYDSLLQSSAKEDWSKDEGTTGKWKNTLKRKVTCLGWQSITYQPDALSVSQEATGSGTKYTLNSITPVVSTASAETSTTPSGYIIQADDRIEDIYRNFDNWVNLHLSDRIYLKSSEANKRLNGVYYSNHSMTSGVETYTPTHVVGDVVSDVEQALLIFSKKQLDSTEKITDGSSLFLRISGSVFFDFNGNRGYSDTSLKYEREKIPYPCGFKMTIRVGKYYLSSMSGGQWSTERFKFSPPLNYKDEGTLDEAEIGSRHVWTDGFNEDSGWCIRLPQEFVDINDVEIVFYRPYNMRYKDILVNCVISNFSLEIKKFNPDVESNELIDDDVVYYVPSASNSYIENYPQESMKLTTFASGHVPDISSLIKRGSDEKLSYNEFLRYSYLASRSNPREYYAPEEAREVMLYSIYSEPRMLLTITLDVTAMQPIYSTFEYAYLEGRKFVVISADINLDLMTVTYLLLEVPERDITSSLPTVQKKLATKNYMRNGDIKSNYMSK